MIRILDLVAIVFVASYFVFVVYTNGFSPAAWLTLAILGAVVIVTRPWRAQRLALSPTKAGAGWILIALLSAFIVYVLSRLVSVILGGHSQHV